MPVLVHPRRSSEPVEWDGVERRRRARHGLSRGVPPYLMALDVTAWAVAVVALGRYDLPHVALLLIMLPLLASAGAYRSRLSMYVLADGGRLAGRILIATTIVITGDLVLGGGEETVHLLSTAAVIAVLVCVLRGIGYAVVRYARSRGIVTHRTLVLGAGQIGTLIVDLLKAHPEYGLRPVGFLDHAPLLPAEELPAPLLGDADALATTIRQQGIEDVIVAFGGLPGHELVEVIRTCDRLDCEIFFVPRLFELHATATDMDAVWGMPLIRHRRAAFRSTSWRVKRVVDVLFSGLALLLVAPVMGLIALAVRLEGPGVIFRQTRVGLDGRPFEVLKFRSLRPADEAESATRWNVARDDRLGRTGRFLRKYSLDELPQLWNILRGDMSLVGPRPERPHFVDSFSSSLPRYIARHRVPAGLTGWAQVHGLRGDTSIADRARFDNYYIENWSLGLDLRILLMTVLSVVSRRGG
jgi:exopolysaccharide biosynthesis polyprenyl glycosylphosphotransferase